jgi:hypothetical protein
VAFERAHPSVIAPWLRDRWRIENSVHYMRDVTFDEGASTRLARVDSIAEACRITAFSVDRGLDVLSGHRNNRSQAC